jgi:hypothetical protein
MINNYQNAKENAQRLYNNIHSIYSPVFKERVIFPADGFNHIVFKKPRMEREKSSQLLRFKLLYLAKELISISTTYQEYEELFKEFPVKKYKQKANENRLVKYWGIIAIINNQKIKVIIRKIGDNGSRHFWSVIPAWITNKHRDIKYFTTMKGSPEED